MGVDGRQESSGNQVRRGHIEVPRDGSDNFYGDPSGSIPCLLGNPSNRYDNVGVDKGFVKSLGIGICQAVLKDCGLFARSGDFFRGFDGFNDYICAAELSNLVLCLLTGAFSDGKHGNNGRDTENDSKHSKGRA